MPARPLQAGAIRAGAISLWLERSGAGPPLLLIAGLGYAVWCWQELREALGGRFELLAFDNRGAGRSDKPPGPYSMPMLADDAAALLDAAGTGAAHVLGHSMGGYIALTFALRHRARLRSLVLVGTSRGGPDTSPVPEETMAAWRLAGVLPPHEYARRSLPQSFAPGWAERNPEAFERLLARRLEFPTPAASWQAQYEACAEFVGRGIDARGIDAPALVVHGRADRVVPHRNGELLAADLPRAQLASLDGVGHLPMLEAPDRFAQLVAAHLEANA
jgi:3-oxoadipate enol-lactonase